MNYCIVGAETLKVNEKIASISKQVLKGEEALNTVIYDGGNNDFSIARLIEDCCTIPFLSEAKVIIVRNSLFLSTNGSIQESDQIRLLEYLKHPNPSTTLIFTGNFDKLDSRKKIVKSLKGICEVITYGVMDEAQFHAFVRESCKRKGLNINHEAMEELLGRLKPDLLNFSNVLNQLMIYPDELDKKAICALVSRPLEDNVFELVDAVVKQNLKKAMHCWRDLQVINTDPIGLVSLIGNQFRLLYQVKVLSNRSNSESDIASILKVHPYRIKLAKESSRRIPLERLAKLIDSAATLDQNFKMGTTDKVLGFENFLIQTTKG